MRSDDDSDSVSRKIERSVKDLVIPTGSLLERSAKSTHSNECSRREHLSVSHAEIFVHAEESYRAGRGSAPAIF